MLEEELARLRAENEELRSKFRVAPMPDSSEPGQEDSRPIRVVLLPDPTEPNTAGSPNPQAIANMTRVLTRVLSERAPSHEWRAEFDLSHIPEDASCHQLGEALRAVWDSSGSPPATFTVEMGADGARCLRRCLVEGEAASESFEAGYEALAKDVDDLLKEGQAAHDSGADHHAAWALKAVDVILLRLDLALKVFVEGGGGWRKVLAECRPEYDARGKFAHDEPRARLP